ncbi:MAG: hypothetical protein J7L21_07980, partial [Sulfurimonas sp.]|nr:hypothetical protein [Sulfurimonas sp.]
MRYILLILLTFFLFGCGSGDSGSQTGSDIPNYSIQYNETSTEISGQLIFELDKIPQGHTIKLDNFIPVLSDCNIDYTSSVITPETLIFTTLDTQKTATVNVKLLSPCSTSKLTLKAKHQEIYLLNSKIITHTKDVLYDFTVEKTTSLNSYKPILKTPIISITKNSQITDVVVSVFDELNRPASDGDVKIIYPDIITNGINIGSFTPISKTIKDGEATFTYNAPNDLKSLVDGGIDSTV